MPGIRGFLRSIEGDFQHAALVEIGHHRERLRYAVRWPMATPITLVAENGHPATLWLRQDDGTASSQGLG